MSRVYVGMSGGVDSSVCAYLLKKQGYDVIGITLKLWGDVNDDAKKVCDFLGIEHRVLDFSKLFKKKVVDYFTQSYFQGKTPNPCVMCNKNIKFGEMIRYAAADGADFVATGHYALIKEDNGRRLLFKSNSVSKDQTYVLYNMTQNELKRTLMPLGQFENKDEIREVAKKIGLFVADKPDSQDICFIPDGDYVKFLKEYTVIPEKKGAFVDTDGNIIGTHNGVLNFTIGQRKGLGMTFGKPMFVTDINAKTNTVTLGEAEEVFKSSLIATDVNLIPYEKLNEPKKFMCKTRYRAKPAECTAYQLENGDVKIEFLKPERAITPGQAAVLYDKDLVVGGGIIL